MERGKYGKGISRKGRGRKGKEEKQERRERVTGK